MNKVYTFYFLCVFHVTGILSEHIDRLDEIQEKPYFLS